VELLRTNGDSSASEHCGRAYRAEPMEKTSHSSHSVTSRSNEQEALYVSHEMLQKVIVKMSMEKRMFDK
jgi:hypothetical protein